MFPPKNHLSRPFLNVFIFCFSCFGFQLCFSADPKIKHTTDTNRLIPAKIQNILCHFAKVWLFSVMKATICAEKKPGKLTTVWAKPNIVHDYTMNISMQFTITPEITKPIGVKEMVKHVMEMIHLYPHIAWIANSMEGPRHVAITKIFLIVIFANLFELRSFLLMP